MEGDDVLEDEDLFGVPPQSEGKEVIGKKTWRNALGGHRGHEAVYFDLSQRFYWNGPFSILFVDHVEIPAKNPFEFTHVLTMMDGFTNFLIAEPVTTTETWKTEAVVWDRVVCALGRVPEVIVYNM